MEIELIPRKLEKPFRDALGHAIKDEIDELAEGLLQLSDEQMEFCFGMSATVAGFVAIDVCGRQWPDEDNLHGIAGATTRWPGERKFDLQAEDSYSFVKRIALGGERWDAVFPEPADRAYLPIVITGRLLVSFCPRELEWWEYLDVIEASFEVTARMDLALLPSLMLRSRRLGNPRTFKQLPR